MIMVLLIYTIILSFKWWHSYRYITKHSPKACGQTQMVQSITIMQPILSGDPELAAMLEQNLRNNQAPTYLWLIDQDDAVGKSITQVLQHQYAHIDIQIVECPPCPEGINPKLLKLNIGAGLIEEGLVVILDDDTVLPAATLSALAEALNVGKLATALPYYQAAKGGWASITAQFVNSNSALTYLSQAQLVGAVTLNGMCYALGLKDIRALDNFKGILKELTDDYALATILKQSGHKIVQVPQPVYVKTSVANGQHYISLMHRWFVFSTLLWASEPWRKKAFIGVLYAMPPVLFAIVVCQLLFLATNPASFIISGLALAIRSFMIVTLNKRLTGKARHHVLASIIAELAQTFHLIHASLVRSIRWRSRRYVVKANGQFKNVST